MDLFGTGGGKLVADEITKVLGTEAPILGQIPFDVALREGGDDGKPLVISNPDAPASMAIRAMAERLGKRPRGLAGMSLNISPTRK